jgi:hypothetical protein
MDYSVGGDPDNFDECADWVRVVLNHPGGYRILTGKQLHSDFDDQMKSANTIIWLFRIPQIISLGAVALTGLNGNYIVGKLQCRVFKRPANATDRNSPC